MANGAFDKNGKLKKEYLPAIYFDSSVIIDYWSTEGMETSEHESPYLQTVRDILRSEKRIEKVTKIRKKLCNEKVKVTPIISPLSILELTEWLAESAFKQIASDASGVFFIQKKSKKEIGDYLKKTLELRKKESEELKKMDKENQGPSTGLELLINETHLNPSFAECHGLQGLLFCDIINFNILTNEVWNLPSLCAYLQLGLTDIIHVLFAQHLGCEYIASFDTDFKRVKDIVFENTGITILTNPEEILSIL